MRRTLLAFAGAVTIGVLTASPAARQRPAAPDNAADVKTLLFELANSMGMLRGLQQEDSILTLEHWAKGTMTVGQQTFDVPEYRLSINYSVPGMRVDFRRQAAGGQPQRQIEVVSGAAAWNETERGRNATAARDRVKERLVYLWTTPMGVVKAARLAGAKATVKTAGGTTVLSFPLPAPADDVTVNATVRRDASLAGTGRGGAQDARRHLHRPGRDHGRRRHRHDLRRVRRLELGRLPGRHHASPPA